MREDRRRFKTAIDAFNKGKKEKARKIFIELRASTLDELLKIDVDLALLSCLNQANDHTLLLEVCNEGIGLASANKLGDAEAAFCAMKAVTLLQKQPVILHRMKCITLPPEWFEFATEKERDEYCGHEKMLEEISKESNSLFQNAKSIASTGHQIQSKLMYDEARIKSQIFDARFLLSQRINKRVFKWRLWSMSREDKKELRKLLIEIESLHLESARVLALGGDETGYAYSYFALAAMYRGAWKYRKADAYLKKAEVVAKKYQLKQILSGIAEVRKDLKQKNVSSEDVDYKDFLGPKA